MFSEATSSLLTFVGVGLLWGVTNPFIKKGTHGVEKIHETNVFRKIIQEIKFLLLNWKFTLPFIVNQCGSVLYFINLKYSDLTVAVPVTNSLAFVFTALTGWHLGEESPDVLTFLGMIFVAMGISCYVLA